MPSISTASTPVSSPFSQNKSPNKSFPVSPLKRQMDGTMIGTGADGNPAKKQLTFGANATQIEDDGAPSTTIEFDTSVAST
ncbi:hypothetical protein LIER_39747 [Lithospermum erythrorhizon]|uniref:Uncharacterized protein n=1 Tax=Lithospermum erythrorhizon TaxID=34254 RepID=A0AAV3QJP7_LITER